MPCGLLNPWGFYPYPRDHRLCLRSAPVFSLALGTPTLLLGACPEAPSLVMLSTFMCSATFFLSVEPACSILLLTRTALHKFLCACLAANLACLITLMLSEVVLNVYLTFYPLPGFRSCPQDRLGIFMAPGSSCGK